MTYRSKRYWDLRSKTFKDNPRGVLFGFPFPSVVNRSFDRWSQFQVSADIPKHKKLFFLDVGCGYGRLSQYLLQKYPNIYIKGLDQSQTFVDIFNKNLSPRGRAIRSTLPKINYQNGAFDQVIMVSTLMYLPDPSEQFSTIKTLLRVLKKNGRIIIIERTPLLGNFELFKKLHLKNGPAVTAFSEKQMSSLIKENGGVITKVSSWPSRFFPLFFSYTISKKR